MAASFFRLVPATCMDGMDGIYAAALDLPTSQPVMIATHSNACPASPPPEQLEAAVQPTASLQAELPGIAVDSSGKHGISPVWVEAAAFAWLAQRRLE